MTSFFEADQKFTRIVFSLFDGLNDAPALLDKSGLNKDDLEFRKLKRLTSADNFGKTKMYEFLTYIPKNGKRTEYKDIVCCEFIRQNNLEVKVNITVADITDNISETYDNEINDSDDEIETNPVEEIKKKVVFYLSGNRDYIIKKLCDKIMGMRLKLIHKKHPSFHW